MPLPTSTLLHFTLLALTLIHTTSDNYFNCSSSDHYVTGSTFESNLKNLLASLLTNALSNSGFSEGYNGMGPDQVFGLMMCRPDFTLTDCLFCLEYAVSIYNTEDRPCANSATTALFYDQCLVRYSRKNFTSRYDTSVHPYCIANVMNMTNQTEAVSSLPQMMASLRPAVPYAPQKLVNRTLAGTNITGFIQCTRDLSLQDCDKCIGDALTIAKSCSRDWNAQGMRVAGLSCYMRYESVPYTITEFPKILVPSPPSSSVVRTDGSGGSSYAVD
jgi:Salt stress response/antifungal